MSVERLDKNLLLLKELGVKLNHINDEITKRAKVHAIDYERAELAGEKSMCAKITDEIKRDADVLKKRAAQFRVELDAILMHE